jgi:hypothetical protein
METETEWQVYETKRQAAIAASREAFRDMIAFARFDPYCNWMLEQIEPWYWGA